jgi:hypothetical protein
MDELIEADLGNATRALEDMVRRRSELRRDCEDAVVEWRWARQASDLQRPEPLYHLRAGLPAPKLLKDAPRLPSDEQQYGFDAGGDIVVTREYMIPGSFREELRVRRDDTVTGYRWSETGEPMEVNIARFDAGKIQSLVTVWPKGRPNAPHGSSIERYEYDGDLLSEIYEESLDAFGDEPPQRRQTRIRALYDPLGRLSELREQGDGGEKVLYRASGTGPSMDKLQRRVEDRLVAVLPALVREHADEPIYCLALHYELESPLPPTVALGLERDREAWMQTIDNLQTLKLTVWNPAEFSNYSGESIGGSLTDVDAELARAVNAIPENADGAAERGRSALNRAARRLQKLDWPSIAPVTYDFAVFAVDLELTHLDENLGHSVPASLRKRLSSRGLL